MVLVGILRIRIGRNFTDPRGKDFPEILKVAADRAGIELKVLTDEEREVVKEKADIHNLYTVATEIYHNNLEPYIRKLITEKWGIADETIDKLQIGYATEGHNLMDLDPNLVYKSGLVYQSGNQVFDNRIVFPYWKNGKVVYLIGRATSKTPCRRDGSNPTKYKKLLVHKEGQEYVSPLVQNSYFYGEDSLRGTDYCIITEGVADCIAMLQAGFPCISPVTVQFRKEDHLKLMN